MHPAKKEVRKRRPSFLKVKSSAQSEGDMIEFQFSADPTEISAQHGPHVTRTIRSRGDSRSKLRNAWETGDADEKDVSVTQGSMGPPAGSDETSRSRKVVAAPRVPRLQNMSDMSPPENIEVLSARISRRLPEAVEAGSGFQTDRPTEVERDNGFKKSQSSLRLKSNIAKSPYGQPIPRKPNLRAVAEALPFRRRLVDDEAVRAEWLQKLGISVAFVKQVASNMAGSLLRSTSHRSRHAHAVRMLPSLRFCRFCLSPRSRLLLSGSSQGGYQIQSGRPSRKKVSGELLIDDEPASSDLEDLFGIARCLFFIALSVKRISRHHIVQETSVRFAMACVKYVLGCLCKLIEVASDQEAPLLYSIHAIFAMRVSSQLQAHLQHVGLTIDFTAMTAILKSLCSVSFELFRQVRLVHKRKGQRSLMEAFLDALMKSDSATNLLQSATQWFGGLFFIRVVASSDFQSVPSVDPNSDFCRSLLLYVRSVSAALEDSSSAISSLLISFERDISPNAFAGLEPRSEVCYDLCGDIEVAADALWASMSVRIDDILTKFSSTSKFPLESVHNSLRAFDNIILSREVLNATSSRIAFNTSSTDQVSPYLVAYLYAVIGKHLPTQGTGESKLFAIASRFAVDVIAIMFVDVQYESDDGQKFNSLGQPVRLVSDLGTSILALEDEPHDTARDLESPQLHRLDSIKIDPNGQLMQFLYGILHTNFPLVRSILISLSSGQDSILLFSNLVDIACGDAGESSVVEFVEESLDRWASESGAAFKIDPSAVAATKHFSYGLGRRVMIESVIQASSVLEHCECFIEGVSPPLATFFSHNVDSFIPIERDWFVASSSTRTLLVSSAVEVVNVLVSQTSFQTLFSPDVANENSSRESTIVRLVETVLDGPSSALGKFFNAFVESLQQDILQIGARKLSSNLSVRSYLSSFAESLFVQFVEEIFSIILKSSFALLPQERQVKGLQEFNVVKTPEIIASAKAAKARTISSGSSTAIALYLNTYCWIMKQREKYISSTASKSLPSSTIAALKEASKEILSTASKKQKDGFFTSAVMDVVDGVVDKIVHEDAEKRGLDVDITYRNNPKLADRAAKRVLREAKFRWNANNASDTIRQGLLNDVALGALLSDGVIAQVQSDVLQAAARDVFEGLEKVSFFARQHLRVLLAIHGELLNDGSVSDDAMMSKCLDKVRNLFDQSDGSIHFGWFSTSADRTMFFLLLACFVVKHGSSQDEIDSFCLSRLACPGSDVLKKLIAKHGYRAVDIRRGHVISDKSLQQRVSVLVTDRISTLSELVVQRLLEVIEVRRRQRQAIMGAASWLSPILRDCIFRSVADSSVLQQIISSGRSRTASVIQVTVKSMYRRIQATAALFVAKDALRADIICECLDRLGLEGGELFHFSDHDCIVAASTLLFCLMHSLKVKFSVTEPSGLVHAVTSDVLRSVAASMQCPSVFQTDDDFSFVLSSLSRLVALPGFKDLFEKTVSDVERVELASTKRIDVSFVFLKNFQSLQLLLAAEAFCQEARALGTFLKKGQLLSRMERSFTDPEVDGVLDKAIETLICSVLSEALKPIASDEMRLRNLGQRIDRDRAKGLQMRSMEVSNILDSIVDDAVSVDGVQLNSSILAHSDLLNPIIALITKSCSAKDDELERFFLSCLSFDSDWTASTARPFDSPILSSLAFPIIHKLASKLNNSVSRVLQEGAVSLTINFDDTSLTCVGLEVVGFALSKGIRASCSSQDLLNAFVKSEFGPLSALAYLHIQLLLRNCRTGLSPQATVSALAERTNLEPALRDAAAEVGRLCIRNVFTFLLITICSSPRKHRRVLQKASGAILASFSYIRERWKGSTVPDCLREIRADKVLTTMLSLPAEEFARSIVLDAKASLQEVFSSHKLVYIMRCGLLNYGLPLDALQGEPWRSFVLAELAVSLREGTRLRALQDSRLFADDGPISSIEAQEALAKTVIRVFLKLRGSSLRLAELRKNKRAIQEALAATFKEAVDTFDVSNDSKAIIDQTAVFIEELIVEEKTASQLLRPDLPADAALMPLMRRLELAVTQKSSLPSVFATLKIVKSCLIEKRVSSLLFSSQFGASIREMALESLDHLKDAVRKDVDAAVNELQSDSLLLLLQGASSPTPSMYYDFALRASLSSALQRLTAASIDADMQSLAEDLVLRTLRRATLVQALVREICCVILTDEAVTLSLSSQDDMLQFPAEKVYDRMVSEWTSKAVLRDVTTRVAENLSVAALNEAVRSPLLSAGRHANPSIVRLRAECCILDILQTSSSQQVECDVDFIFGHMIDRRGSKVSNLVAAMIQEASTALGKVLARRRFFRESDPILHLQRLKTEQSPSIEEELMKIGALLHDLEVAQQLEDCLVLPAFLTRTQSCSSAFVREIVIKATGLCLDPMSKSRALLSEASKRNPSQSEIQAVAHEVSEALADDSSLRKTLDISDSEYVQDVAAELTSMIGADADFDSFLLRHTMAAVPSVERYVNYFELPWVLLPPLMSFRSHILDSVLSDVQAIGGSADVEENNSIIPLETAALFGRIVALGSAQWYVHEGSSEDQIAACCERLFVRDASFDRLQSHESLSQLKESLSFLLRGLPDSATLGDLLRLNFDSSKLGNDFLSIHALIEASSHAVDTPEFRAAAAAECDQICSDYVKFVHDFVHSAPQFSSVVQAASAGRLAWDSKVFSRLFKESVEPLRAFISRRSDLGEQKARACSKLLRHVHRSCLTKLLSENAFDVVCAMYYNQRTPWQLEDDWRMVYLFEKVVEVTVALLSVEMMSLLSKSLPVLNVGLSPSAVVCYISFAILDRLNGSVSFENLTDRIRKEIRSIVIENNLLKQSLVSIDFIVPLGKVINKISGNDPFPIEVIEVCSSFAETFTSSMLSDVTYLWRCSRLRDLIESPVGQAGLRNLVVSAFRQTCSFKICSAFQQQFLLQVADAKSKYCASLENLISSSTPSDAIAMDMFTYLNFKLGWRRSRANCLLADVVMKRLPHRLSDYCRASTTKDILQMKIPLKARSWIGLGAGVYNYLADRVLESSGLLNGAGDPCLREITLRIADIDSSMSFTDMSPVPASVHLMQRLSHLENDLCLLGDQFVVSLLQSFLIEGCKVDVGARNFLDDLKKEIENALQEYVVDLNTVQVRSPIDLVGRCHAVPECSSLISLVDQHVRALSFHSWSHLDLVAVCVAWVSAQKSADTSSQYASCCFVGVLEDLATRSFDKQSASQCDAQLKTMSTLAPPFLSKILFGGLLLEARRAKQPQKSIIDMRSVAETLFGQVLPMEDENAAKLSSLVLDCISKQRFSTKPLTEREVLSTVRKLSLEKALGSSLVWGYLTYLLRKEARTSSSEGSGSQPFVHQILGNLARCAFVEKLHIRQLADVHHLTEQMQAGLNVSPAVLKQYSERIVSSVTMPPDAVATLTSLKDLSTPAADSLKASASYFLSIECALALEANVQTSCAASLRRIREFDVIDVVWFVLAFSIEDVDAFHALHLKEVAALSNTTLASCQKALQADWWELCQPLEELVDFSAQCVLSTARLLAQKFGDAYPKSAVTRSVVDTVKHAFQKLGKDAKECIGKAARKVRTAVRVMRIVCAGKFQRLLQEEAVSIASELQKSLSSTSSTSSIVELKNRLEVDSSKKLAADVLHRSGTGSTGHQKFVLAVLESACESGYFVPDSSTTIDDVLERWNVVEASHNLLQDVSCSLFESCLTTLMQASPERSVEFVASERLLGSCAFLAQVQCALKPHANHGIPSLVALSALQKDPTTSKLFDVLASVAGSFAVAHPTFEPSTGPVPDSESIVFSVGASLKRSLGLVWYQSMWDLQEIADIRNNGIARLPHDIANFSLPRFAALMGDEVANSIADLEIATSIADEWASHSSLKHVGTQLSTFISGQASESTAQTSLLRLVLSLCSPRTPISMDSWLLHPFIQLVAADIRERIQVDASEKLKRKLLDPTSLALPRRSQVEFVGAAMTSFLVFVVDHGLGFVAFKDSVLNKKLRAMLTTEKFLKFAEYCFGVEQLNTFDRINKGALSALLDRILNKRIIKSVNSLDSLTTGNLFLLNDVIAASLSPPDCVEDIAALFDFLERMDRLSALTISPVSSCLATESIKCGATVARSRAETMLALAKKLNTEVDPRKKFMLAKSEFGGKANSDNIFEKNVADVVSNVLEVAKLEMMPHSRLKRTVDNPSATFLRQVDFMGWLRMELVQRVCMKLAPSLEQFVDLDTEHSLCTLIVDFGGFIQHAAPDDIKTSLLSSGPHPIEGESALSLVISSKAEQELLRSSWPEESSEVLSRSLSHFVSVSSSLFLKHNALRLVTRQDSSEAVEQSLLKLMSTTLKPSDMIPCVPVLILRELLTCCSVYVHEKLDVMSFVDSLHSQASVDASLDKLVVLYAPEVESRLHRRVSIFHAITRICVSHVAVDIEDNEDASLLPSTDIAFAALSKDFAMRRKMNLFADRKSMWIANSVREKCSRDTRLEVELKVAANLKVADFLKEMTHAILSDETSVFAIQQQGGRDVVSEGFVFELVEKFFSAKYKGSDSESSRRSLLSAIVRWMVQNQQIMSNLHVRAMAAIQTLLKQQATQRILQSQEIKKNVLECAPLVAAELSLNCVDGVIATDGAVVLLRTGLRELSRKVVREVLSNCIGTFNLWKRVASQKAPTSLDNAAAIVLDNSPSCEPSADDPIIVELANKIVELILKRDDIKLTAFEPANNLDKLAMVFAKDVLKQEAIFKILRRPVASNPQEQRGHEEEDHDFIEQAFRDATAPTNPGHGALTGAMDAVKKDVQESVKKQLSEMIPANPGLREHARGGSARVLEQLVGKVVRVCHADPSMRDRLSEASAVALINSVAPADTKQSLENLPKDQIVTLAKLINDKFKSLPEDSLESVETVLAAVQNDTEIEGITQALSAAMAETVIRKAVDAALKDSKVENLMNTGATQVASGLAKLVAEKLIQDETLKTLASLDSVVPTDGLVQKVVTKIVESDAMQSYVAGGSADMVVGMANEVVQTVLNDPEMKKLAMDGDDTAKLTETVMEQLLEALPASDSSSSSIAPMKELVEKTLVSWHSRTQEGSSEKSFGGIPVLRVVDTKSVSVAPEALSEEEAYFRSFVLTPTRVRIAKSGMALRSVVVSPNGRFLAVAPHNGSLWVLDLSFMPPVILRQGLLEDPSIVIIRWAMDCSNLITLDETGCIRMWTLCHPRGAEVMSKEGDFVPPEVLMLITYPSILRVVERNPPPKMKPLDAESSSKSLRYFVKKAVSTTEPVSVLNVSNAADSRIYSLEFHSSFTVSGKQPSFLLGMGGGAIVKQNTQDTKLCIFGLPPQVERKGKVPELEYMIGHKWVVAHFL